MNTYLKVWLNIIQQTYQRKLFVVNIKCKFNGDPITFGFNFEPAAILGTFVFRGFFMPEYCFLRRYSSKVSAFFAKFLLYFSRCTRSELLCRCHSFRLKSQDFSGLCSRRYIRAFPTICRCQRQTIPHRLRRKKQYSGIIMTTGLAGGLYWPYKGLLPALSLKTRRKVHQPQHHFSRKPHGLFLFLFLYWLTRKRVNVLFECHLIIF